MAKADYEAMLAHLLAVYPLEGCGFLAGSEGHVRRLYPIRNIMASAYRYQMDPQQQLQALQERAQPSVRAFSIVQGKVDEVDLKIV